MKDVNYRVFRGINNRLPPTSLNSKEGRWLADAVNVDIDNSGDILRRFGASRIAEVTAPHSLFENLLVRDSVLYRVTLPAYSETMLRLLSTNDTMRYQRVGEQLYMTNGVDYLRMDCDGNVVPWGLPVPAAPTVTPVPGELSAGLYTITVSYTSCSEEGPTSPYVQVELQHGLNGGVRVTLPPAVEGASHINVYVSGNGGAVPLLAQTVEVGEVNVDIVSIPTGREASSRVEAPLPAGTHLFEFNNRLCTVVGDTLYYGLPYRHGYYAPLTGRIAFNSPVTIAIGNQDGAYVATEDMTHFISGNDLGGEGELRDIFPYGAVPGTEFTHTKVTKVGWFSHRGIVVADAGGAVEPMMYDSVELATVPAGGFSAVFEDDRRPRVVSCGWSMNLLNGGVTRYDNFTFTSINGGYATAPDGVYALDDSDVPWSVDIGLESFGTQFEKHMPVAYVSAASDNPVTLRVGLTNGDAYDYTARTSSETLGVHRIEPAKGLRDNWFRLTMIDEAGGDFHMAGVSFSSATSNRKV